MRGGRARGLAEPGGGGAGEQPPRQRPRLPVRAAVRAQEQLPRPGRFPGHRYDQHGAVRGPEPDAGAVRAGGPVEQCDGVHAGAVQRGTVRGAEPRHGGRAPAGGQDIRGSEHVPGEPAAPAPRVPRPQVLRDHGPGEPDVRGGAGAQEGHARHVSEHRPGHPGYRVVRRLGGRGQTNTLFNHLMFFNYIIITKLVFI